MSLLHPCWQPRWVLPPPPHPLWRLGSCVPSLLATSLPGGGLPGISRHSRPRAACPHSVAQTAAQAVLAAASCWGGGPLAHLEPATATSGFHFFHESVTKHMAPLGTTRRLFNVVSVFLTPSLPHHSRVALWKQSWARGPWPCSPADVSRPRVGRFIGLSSVIEARTVPTFLSS